MGSSSLWCCYASFAAYTISASASKLWLAPIIPSMKHVNLGAWWRSQPIHRRGALMLSAGTGNCKSIGGLVGRVVWVPFDPLKCSLSLLLIPLIYQCPNRLDQILIHDLLMFGVRPAILLPRFVPNCWTIYGVITVCDDSHMVCLWDNLQGSKYSSQFCSLIRLWASLQWLRNISRYS